MYNQLINLYMGKSYRKPFITEQSGHPKHSKFAKRSANKRVRTYEDTIDSGSGYKKISESWDINDYSINLENYKHHGKMTEQEYREYLKSFTRK